MRAIRKYLCLGTLPPDASRAPYLKQVERDTMLQAVNGDGDPKQRAFNLSVTIVSSPGVWRSTQRGPNT